MPYRNQTSRRALVIDYKGSWNIGAYGLATDSYALFGDGFRPKILRMAEEALKVPIITHNIMDEPIIGILAVANSNGIIVPHQTSDAEIKSIHSKVGVPVEKLSLRDYENALGNLLLVNDKYCIVHKNTAERNKEEMQRIADVLDVEILSYDFSFPIVGTVAMMTSKGILTHPAMNDEELDWLKRETGLRVGKGTVNMGSPYIRSGLIANSNGFLAGLKTTGLELQRIYEVLVK